VRQKVNIPQEQVALSSHAMSTDPDFLRQTKRTSKAFGDTIYYQDFNGGLPAGWTIVDNTSNNFIWKWDTVYQNGQLSSPNNVLVSSTAANGFMSLPADFYNTPIPSTGPVGMDTYFESGAIDLTKNGIYPNGLQSVWVTYQQSLRYCCSGSNKLVLQVSTDNFTTFSEYDATNGIALSSAIASQTNIIKITDVAASATSIKIRFLSKDNSHYYWMIDDFAIIEGPRNDLELRSPYLEFSSSYTYNPFYSQIPSILFPQLTLSGFVYNNGSNDLTGVRIEGDIFNTVAQGGTPLGLVYFATSNPSFLETGITRDTADYVVTNQPSFLPPICGDYRVDMIATSDSIDENLGNEVYSHNFTVTDTVWAKDDNGYSGGIGPGSFARVGQTGGTAVGDRFGTMYVVESRIGNGGSSQVPTSVTYAVSKSPFNIGVEIVPKIWKYEEDSLFAPASGTIAAAFAGGEVASSFIPYTIQAGDTNTLLTLPLDNGSAVFNGLDSGQYVVGWEVTNTNGGNSFEVQVDPSSGQFQKLITCFVDLAHQPGWGWVDANPVIRLNMANLPITGCGTSSLENVLSPKELSISIQPNPNSGLFNLTISNEIKTTCNLTVRNLLGQSIYTETISVNGTITKQVDLTEFEKGVYVISLENGAERILKKVVVQ